MRGALTLLLLLSGAAHAAQPPPLDQVLKRLDAASKGVTSLSGEFTQVSRVKLFKQEVRSKGRLAFRAPRNIRWEYTDPDPSTLALEGDQATLTAPGAPPQVFDLARDATLRTLFDQLLLFVGPGSLDRARADYDMTVAGTAEAPIVALTPHPTSPTAKAFQKIELRLDPKTWLLRSILLVEKNGDEKEITFTRLVRST